MGRQAPENGPGHSALSPPSTTPVCCPVPSRRSPHVNINRGLVFWGVALITAGVVALAIQSGAIDGENARQLWRLWPVALIAIGVAVIAARTPFALAATLAAGMIVGGMAGTL